MVAAVFALLAVTAAASTPLWPAGRWVAVHLFILGVLANTVIAMSLHFATTLTRTRDGDARILLWLVNVGTVSVIGGRLWDITWLVAAGATLVSGAVAVNLRTIRAMRRAAVGARFAFVVRSYERAHAAFLLGALLGAIIAAGAAPGTWYSAIRIAHVHVNVLGFGGLTLLATLVFFGPTMLRTRIEPDADAVAARALQWGVAALAIAVAALLVTGAGGPWATPGRVAAGLGLLGYAAATAAVCAPVVRAARRAGDAQLRPHVVGACAWFTAGVAADAVAVLLRSPVLLDVAALAVLVGGLAQAILASTAYVVTVVRRSRDVPSVRRLQPIAMNVGVGLMVASVPLGGTAGMLGYRGGIGITGLVIVTELGSAAIRLMSRAEPRQ